MIREWKDSAPQVIFRADSRQMAITLPPEFYTTIASSQRGISLDIFMQWDNFF